MIALSLDAVDVRELIAAAAAVTEVAKHSNSLLLFEFEVLAFTSDC